LLRGYAVVCGSTLAIERVHNTLQPPAFVFCFLLLKYPHEAKDGQSALC
jgi:hypothetical protein